MKAKGKAKIIKEPPKMVLAPTTTSEQNTVTAGQRAINLIWENTQSQIAKVTVYSNNAMNIVVIVAIIVVDRKIDPAFIALILAAMASINQLSGIIIGFYFSRTNHSAIGGVGPKESPSTLGTR